MDSEVQSLIHRQAHFTLPLPVMPLYTDTIYPRPEQSLKGSFWKNVRFARERTWLEAILCGEKPLVLGQAVTCQ